MAGVITVKLGKVKLSLGGVHQISFFFASMSETALPERQQPIPPPSHPRQFRAIGLVYGHYYPSQESVTRGVLVTEEGAMIEAVLLGRMLSVIKKHLDLSQPHLWVIYPRMRDNDDHLHFQLAGVWEPQTLGPGSVNYPLAASAGLGPTPVQKGQFSIRGEVVFVGADRPIVVVKIRQSPRPHQKRPQFFKVKLEGKLDAQALGHFWDLQVYLAGNQLILTGAKDLGPYKRKPSQRPFSIKPTRREGVRSSGGDRPRLRPPLKNPLG
jgi:hypothetical protein